MRQSKATLRDLLDATERRYQELDQTKPAAFFLYVDQAEELYVRSEEDQRRRFSALLAEGLADPRLRALMSLRADFLGALQNDPPLYGVHEKIDVPPLREAELREAVSRPAELLSARFETDALAADIAQRTAEESAKDAGRCRSFLICSTTCGRRWSGAAMACCVCRRGLWSLAACSLIAPMRFGPLSQG